MRRRWLLLLTGLPLYMFGLALAGWFVLVALLADDLGGVKEGLRALGDPEWWAVAFIPAGIITAAQAALVLPAFRYRLPRAAKSKSLVLSCLLLGAAAGALVLGLVIALYQLVLEVTGGIDIGDDNFFLWLWWTPLIVGWIFWSVIFITYGARARRPEARIGRLIGLLLGGTIVEILIVIPIDIMVRRRTDCYCATGSFFALALSAAACLSLAGPGAIFVLTAKRRRLWYAEHCEVCAYAMGPSPGPRCPECGFEWMVARRERPAGAGRDRKGD